ncbi:MAG: hypothetical protein Q9162_001807 [Coniocarpon cinnabarinum]
MGRVQKLTQVFSDRFYGVTENKREVDMDMREMVEKVKKGEPLYGETELTDYMQGVAARNSRYSATFLHVMPMFNFVNHNQHGVDTAKYYQQAERELEAERIAKGTKFEDGKLDQRMPSPSKPHRGSTPDLKLRML